MPGELLQAGSRGTVDVKLQAIGCAETMLETNTCCLQEKLPCLFGYNESLFLLFCHYCGNHRSQKHPNL